jgi:hypothetical protein
MVRMILALVVVVTLVGCVILIFYGSVIGDNLYGFIDQCIEENCYRIIFRGNSSMTREVVEIFLLFRAVELMVDSGYDYFVVTEQNTKTNKHYSTQSNPTFFKHYYYNYKPYYYTFPYYTYN